MTISTRLLAGVSVPDSPLVSRAIEYARENSEPYLFNHVMRSWLFAVALARHKGTAHDEEVLAVATILHDLGLAAAFNGPLRFEVEGANQRPLKLREESVLGPCRIETIEILLVVQDVDVLLVESRLEQRGDGRPCLAVVADGPDHAIRRVRDEVPPVSARCLHAMTLFDGS